MSRFKPSNNVVGDGDITVTDIFPDGTQTEYESGVALYNRYFSNGILVPETKVNPLVNGWRAPSSYLAQSLVINSKREIVDSNGLAFLCGLEKVTAQGRSDYPPFIRKWQGKGAVAAYASVAPLLTSHNHINNLRMKILNNIQDEKFDVAMLLAEIGKTATTGSGIMNRIGRSMLMFQKSKPKSFSYLWHGRTHDNRRPTDKFLRETAGAYLEWKYGVMPSVYDLQGITEQLDANSKGLFDSPPLMVSRAKVVNNSTTVANVYLNGPAKQVGVKTTSTYSARADFTVSGEGLRGLNRYGLGLTSLATIAYDTYPFSFVFNMIVPMAEIIKAWGALAGVSVLGYTETVHHKYESSGGSIPFSFNNIGIGDRTVTVPPFAFSAFTRTGGTSIPFPVPFIRNPVKVGNIATVLSLFTTLRSKA